MKVSIAIPFYNNEGTLADAVRSVFAQSFADWELILLDDGSTDGSLSIARRVQDPRVRVLSDGVNRGLVYRLNQGVELARYSAFARMDADDLMHPDRLKSQGEFLEAHPEVDLLGTAVYMMDRYNRPIGFRDETTWMGFWGFVHPTVTGRTAWFRAHPYDPAYPRAEDTELWFRTHATAKVAALPEPLLFYRELDCFQWKKYWQGSASVRRILQHYGPVYRGHLWTWRQVAASWAKCLIYGSLQVAGKEEELIKRRGRTLNPHERAVAESIIRQILMTRMPGVDSTEGSRGTLPGPIALAEGV